MDHPKFLTSAKLENIFRNTRRFRLMDDTKKPLEDMEYMSDTMILKSIYTEVLKLKQEVKEMKEVPVVCRGGPDLIKVTKDPDCVTMNCDFIVKIYDENITKSTNMTREELSDFVLDSSDVILADIKTFYTGPSFLDDIYTPNVRKIVKIKDLGSDLFIYTDVGKSYSLLKPLEYVDFQKKHIDIYYI